MRNSRWVHWCFNCCYITKFQHFRVTDWWTSCDDNKAIISWKILRRWVWEVGNKTARNYKNANKHDQHDNNAHPGHIRLTFLLDILNELNLTPEKQQYAFWIVNQFLRLQFSMHPSIWSEFKMTEIPIKHIHSVITKSNLRSCYTDPWPKFGSLDCFESVSFLWPKFESLRMWIGSFCRSQMCKCLLNRLSFLHARLHI